MPKSSVLLDSLLPVEAVGLGRLVLNVRFPNQDYCEPDEPPVADGIVTQRLENFDYSSEQGDASSIQLILSTLLSGTRGSENGSSIDLSSFICISRQLQNSGQFFEKFCALGKTRAWLERAIRRRKNVFLVTGTKTVTDARIGTTERTGTSSEVNFQVPTSLLTAAAGLPLPDGLLDVGAGGKRSADNSEKHSFLAPGEQVFAVQYRKVRVSWLSNRDVDHACLESGNRWKVYLGGRGEEGEVENIVDIEVGDYIQREDLAETCDAFNLDGEKYLRIE